MTPRQRDIMKHALGAGRGAPGWRNYFVTGPGSDDYDDCEALVAAGMMTKRSAGPLSGGGPARFGRLTFEVSGPWRRGAWAARLTENPCTSRPKGLAGAGPFDRRVMHQLGERRG
jgi:hypothetical protein